EARAAFHLCYGLSRGQVLREHANVSRNIRGNGRTKPDYEGATVGEDVLRQPYRKSDSSGFTWRKADASTGAAKPPSYETQLSILQPESVRSRLGIDPQGSQCRCLCSGGFSQSADGTGHHPA